MKTRLLVSALLFVSALSSGAYTVITDEHVDLQLEYVSGSLRGFVKPDIEGRTELGDALLYDGPSGTTSISRPPSSTWNFLGVSAGQPVYYWPQNNNVGRIYLGFGSDGGTIPGGTFATYYESDARVDATAPWTKITLTAMRYTAAPGETGTANFSLWQIDTFGDAVVWMATSDGISASDATWLVEGGHAHFNWGFTKRGYYELDFVFSGTLASSGNPIQSAVQTFHFGVEFQPAALPEPSSGVLLALSTAALLGRRRRTRMKSV